MEPAAQVEGDVPGMGVLIDNRPRRARAGAARKRSAPSPWLSAGGNNVMCSPSPTGPLLHRAFRNMLSSLVALRPSGRLVRAM